MPVIEQRDIKKEMVLRLAELRKYGLSFAKISFEDEGVSYKASQEFAEIAGQAGLELAVKIGGCEATTDLINVKSLGASHVVATMIESPYAVQKFAGIIKAVYKENLGGARFFINVETITGYQNLPKILESSAMDAVSGVVLGRVDFVSSMGKERSFIDTEDMFKTSLDMANMVAKAGKEMFIGGNITVESFDTFKKFPPGLLTAIETRNGVFDFNEVMRNFKPAISEITGFELLWLKLRKELGDSIDQARIEMLEKRYAALRKKS